MRMARGLRQLDVAQALGVSEGLITKWETGRRSPPDELIAALAGIYDVAEAQVKRAITDANRPGTPRDHLPRGRARRTLQRGIQVVTRPHLRDEQGPGQDHAYDAT